MSPTRGKPAKRQRRGGPPTDRRASFLLLSGVSQKKNRIPNCAWNGLPSC